MKLNVGKPLCFIDLETTGINAAKDRIVEIAVIKISPNGSEERLEQRINPTVAIPLATSLIHGIYEHDVRLMPTFKEFAHDLHQFIGNADLAGYNSNKFDIPLLVEEFLRAEVDFDMRNRRMIDVQNIFMRMEQRTLTAAYKFYLNQKLENAHNAMADVEATYEILMAQLDRYQDVEVEDKDKNLVQPIKNDMQALADFSTHHRNADLMGQIILNDDDQPVFNFGQHKGKLVKEVFERTPGYYDWLMNADFPLYTKRIFTSIKLGVYKFKS